MNPAPSIKTVPLSQIDFNDFSYSVSPVKINNVDKSLEKSICKHGLLHPPIIKQVDSCSYCIIAGRKRLLAVAALRAEGACNCLVVSRQAAEADILYLLLEELRLTRQLSPIEKALFLQKTAGIMDEDQTTSEFLPLLELPASPVVIKQTRMLLDLEDPIILAIHRGDINVNIARKLIPLPGKDRMVLFEIITALGLSFSNQKKLLNICGELASRKKTNIAVILGHEDVQGILRHQHANPPQKAKMLMTRLSREHMPRSGQAEEEFSRFIAAMQLPHNISVEHTPFFEDDRTTLSITFSNRKSMQHAWEKIKDTVHSNDD